jgi:hypothetical protein
MNGFAFFRANRYNDDHGILESDMSAQARLRFVSRNLIREKSVRSELRNGKRQQAAALQIDSIIP